MPDQKFSLENILDEYSPDSKDASTPHVGRVDAQKIINTTVEDPTKLPPPQQITTPKPVSHERNELFDNANRRPDPANEVQPVDLSRKKVAFASSEGISEVQNSAPVNSYAAETENVPDEAPKIRRMSDSTRAREVQRLKGKRKPVQRSGAAFPYKKETPDGEYMYTPPEFQKKKRSRRAILSEAESPEGRRYLTDIVPSPEAVEASRPVIPAPRAEKTSIDLSQRQEMDASALDVHITQDSDELVRVKSRRHRTKRIVDFNYYGDVEDVGRDIYELQGIIASRVVILILTGFLSLYITICNQFSLPIIELLSRDHIGSYLTAHLILGLVSVLISFPVISKGLRNLLLAKADSDSMTAMTAISCLIAIFTAFLRQDMARAETIHIYMPVGILALLINALGKQLIIKRAQRNFKFVSQEFDRHAVVYVRDEERAERLTRGTIGDFPILAAMRKTNFLTDFLRYTYSSDITDSYCRRAAPACLVLSMVISVFLTLFRTGTLASVESAAFGMSIFSMLICASSCIALPFVANIPLENVSRQTLKIKGILLGYQSVDDLYDTNSILVGADKLFPENSVKLGGIKVFSNTKLDEALLEAASLTYHAGSVMQQLFTDVISGREDTLYPIENFSYEEDEGLCGWINNKRVLFGNRELMSRHNIEGLPSKSQEAEYTAEGHEPMYLSVSGNLAAMFTVNITADRYVKKWATKLVKKKVFLIIKSVDPCITVKRISTLFGIPREMLRVLPKKLHEDFDTETKKTVRMSASMACSGRFSSMAQLILGTKVIHSSATIGLIIQTVSILLGFGICMLLILSKAFEFNYIYMTATAMVVYNAACTALTYIGVSLKKI